MWLCRGSCQAEARRLALTTLIVRFTDFLVHKTLFTKGFWLAAAEKLYDGATAETANVVRALAIHNSTLWKRDVHAENFESEYLSRLLRERSGARTQGFLWREWQVDTNQISRTEYNSEQETTIRNAKRYIHYSFNAAKRASLVWNDK